MSTEDVPPEKMDEPVHGDQPDPPEDDDDGQEGDDEDHPPPDEKQDEGPHPPHDPHSPHHHHHHHPPPHHHGPHPGYPPHPHGSPQHHHHHHHPPHHGPPGEGHPDHGDHSQPQGSPSQDGGPPAPPPGHGPPPGYPRPPDGYYQPYPPPPPPGQDGARYPPPPPGYEGGPPPHHMYPPPPGHGMPPQGPGMPPPYPMYPPHQYMYPPPHYHPHYPPPPYGYGPEHHHPPGDRRYDQGGQGSPGGYGGEYDDPKDGNIVPGAVTARLKTYIKPRIPSTQEVLDRRSRKNAQSRARAAKLRDRISEIESKPEQERTEEERTIYSQYESRRQRKNDRSRERALEKKEEIDRILAKPEKKRTKIEKQFLETALSAKKRKNEGDRLRRQRLKELGLSSKGTGVKPGISARGPLPPQYQQQVRQNAGHYQDMPPMSPLPTMPHHHHSPGGFGSPGMMPGMSFPSPGPSQQRRPSDAPATGDVTPGREGGQHLPYMPPDGSEVASAQPGGGDNSRVEQRRNPDGSMSISIGGNGNRSDGEPAYPPGAEGDMSDVHMLLNENDYEGDNGVGEQSGEKNE